MSAREFRQGIVKTNIEVEIISEINYIPKVEILFRICLRIDEKIEYN